MANFFSLQDGSLTDASIYGYSLTGAEVMYNTTAVYLTAGDTYGPIFTGDGSTISAVAVHLSSRQANNTTDSLILKLSAAGKSVQTEYYPISNFTAYDGSNNTIATYPLNWQILKLSTGYQIPNLSSAKISIAATSNNVISLIGVSGTNNFDKAILTNNFNLSSTIFSYVSSLSNNNITLSANSPMGEPSSMYFGTDSTRYVNMPQSMYNNASKGTVECWIYRRSNATNTGMIAAKWHSGAADYGFFTVGNFNCSPYNGVAQNPGSDVLTWTWSKDTGPLTVPVGVWTYVAVCFTTTYISFFINGVLNSTVAANGSMIDDTAASSCRIGSHGFTTNGQMYFDGLISNFRFTKDVLYTKSFTPPTSPYNLNSFTYNPENTSNAYQFLYSYPYNGYVYVNSGTTTKNIHIGSSIKLSATEVCTITADTLSLNDMYVHNRGTLTFPLTSNKTLTLNGSAGLQITSDGTVNIGTSSQNIPLSTTHTLTLSNTQIAVHNGCLLYTSPSPRD